MFPFTDGQIAFQLDQPVRSIRKQMKKLERKGVIKSFCDCMYPSYYFSVSGEWADHPIFAEKRERILAKIRENLHEDNMKLPLPEPLSDDIAGKVWDVRGKPIKTDS